MDIIHVVVAVFLTAVTFIFWEDFQNKCRFLLHLVRGFAATGARIAFLENRVMDLEFQVETFKKYASFDQKYIEELTLSNQLQGEEIYRLKEKSKIDDEKVKASEAAAKIDPLTGLLNRRGFDEVYSHQVGQMPMSSGDRRSPVSSDRKKTGLGIAMLDIDHFKSVNDTFGHLEGDKVLKEFAEVLSMSARSTDIVSRCGGEEIIIALPHVTEEQLVLVAEKFRGVVEEHSFPHGQPLTVSIGTAWACAQEDADGLDRRADEALYLAKDVGRNCVVSAESK